MSGQPLWGDLPATATRLYVNCPALKTLGRLPDTLTELYIQDCTALIHLLPLPPALRFLRCSWSVNLPDACPQALRMNDAY
jgi:hypothetical protein